MNKLINPCNIWWNTQGTVILKLLSEFLSTKESYNTPVEYEQCFWKVLLIEMIETLIRSKRNFGSILILPFNASGVVQW